MLHCWLDPPIMYYPSSGQSFVHISINSTFHPSLTLAEQDVANSGVHVIVDRVSAVDHQTIHKLHGLGPLTPELAGHDHLTALGTALHDETENTIAGPEEDNVSVSHASTDHVCFKPCKNNALKKKKKKSSQTNASMSSSERNMPL